MGNCRFYPYLTGSTMRSTGNANQSTYFLNRLIIILSVLLLIYVSLFSWQYWHDEKVKKLQDMENLLELERKAIDLYFIKIEVDLEELSQELIDLNDHIPVGTEFYESAFILVNRFMKQHPEILYIGLIREDGQMLLTGKEPFSPNLPSVANSPSWMRFREEPRQNRRLNIGRLTKSLTLRELGIPLRYEVRNREGKILFILSNILPVDLLQDFWRNAPFTRTSALGLLRDDCFLVSRYPVPDKMELEKLYNRPRIGALTEHLIQKHFPDHGYTEGSSSIERTPSLVAYKRLENFPITLFVTVPLSEIRAAYWSKIRIPYLLSFLLLLGGYLSYRMIRRQQMKWEEELCISRAFLDNVIEQSPVSMLIFNSMGTIVRTNRSRREWLGISAGNVAGRYNILKDKQIEEQGLMPQVREVFDKGTAIRFTIDYDTSRIRNLKLAEAKQAILDVTMSAVKDSSGRVIHVIVQHMDITRLQSALSEKEVLLKEVHHRVKNNLQVISSLLEMTRSRMADQGISDTLAETCARINSLSIIHSQLYRGSQIDRISMKDYIGTLVNHLLRVFAKNRQVTVNTETHEAVLSLVQAMPCALVFNELITNSLKHAWQPGQAGNITISIEASGDNHVSVLYRDDGIGIAEDMSIQKIKTLGMKLIHILVTKQLKGNLKISRNNGTEVSFDFKSGRLPLN